MNLNEITIFGAGMAGLLAARMLADRHPVVMERQSSLPNNHHALLRFRSEVVGNVTNIPFTKVNVTKHVLGEEGSNPIRDAIKYSRKVTGKLHARSILDTNPVDRYIAPPLFISRLAATANICYDVDFQQWSDNLHRPHGPIISTIPMPVMMDMFSWRGKPTFTSSPGWTYKAVLSPALECNVNGTIYSAREKDLWYRASLTGSVLMIEGVGETPESFDPHEVLMEFGLTCEDLIGGALYSSKYQKIASLSSEERESAKRFIMWLSEEHQIYSLGRFATWRPKLLLDDLVNDVRVITSLIDGKANYMTGLGDG